MKPIHPLVVVAGGVVYYYLLASSSVLGVHGFVIHSTRSSTVSKTGFHNTLLVLGAKKARNKKPKKPSAVASSSGGFGIAAATSSSKSSNTKDDYAVFPALEPEVKKTLVTASSSSSSLVGREEETSGTELSNEIYQRLDQIYGFSNFNYEIVETTTSSSDDDDSSASGGMISMEDLISGNFSEEEDDNDDDNDTTTASDDSCFQISQLPPFDDQKIHVLHVDPLVLSVDDFFTSDESDAYVAMPSHDQTMFQTGSMTVGKDQKSQSQRTSTTWFNHYKNVPALMAKASRLLGLDGISRWEEPQTVRYRRNEKFTWHLDALGPEELESTGGGQRVATLLVYHTDLEEGEGGATMFRDLKDKHGERLKV